MLHSMWIHRMLVDNYLVCYVIDPGVVTVTDVLYGAADVRNKLLKALFFSCTIPIFVIL